MLFGDNRSGIMKRLALWLAAGMVLAAAFIAVSIPAGAAADHTNGAPVPPPDVPGVVTLFSGQRGEIAANWLQRGGTQPSQWKFQDGTMVATDSDTYTRQKFEDFQLHLEFKLPYEPTHHGQDRSNSGVYLQGRYEIQVLDSYGLPDPGKGDCGAVYSQAGPLVKAYRPPLQWQTYDIVFHGARVDATTHKVTDPARVTIFLNGVAIQNNQVITGPTGGQMDDNVGEPGPLLLQYHGHPVQYRDIWILPLPPHGADHY
ncbi:MAG TPA: DUF1080 domain-containing protein [Armatimonadota bacterium]|nr:DUF1080 domain-containing protein [Armatimonadota bacterium]